MIYVLPMFLCAYVVFSFHHIGTGKHSNSQGQYYFFLITTFVASTLSLCTTRTI